MWAHIDQILHPYDSLDIIATTTEFKKILKLVFNGLEDAETIKTVNKIFIEKLKRYSKSSKIIYCSNQLWQISYIVDQKTIALSYSVDWTSIKSQIGELLSINFPPETQTEIKAIDTMFANNKKIMWNIVVR
jgi:hypothetical protein